MAASRLYGDLGLRLEMTHQEIAEALSREEGKRITRQRVVQIEQEALRKLREQNGVGHEHHTRTGA